MRWEAVERSVIMDQFSIHLALSCSSFYHTSLHPLSQPLIDKKWGQKCLNVGGKHQQKHLFTFSQLAILPQLPCYYWHLIKSLHFCLPRCTWQLTSSPEVFLYDPGTFPKCYTCDMKLSKDATVILVIGWRSWLFQNRQDICAVLMGESATEMERFTKVSTVKLTVA